MIYAYRWIIGALDHQWIIQGYLSMDLFVFVLPLTNDSQGILAFQAKAPLVQAQLAQATHNHFHTIIHRFGVISAWLSKGATT